MKRSVVVVGKEEILKADRNIFARLTVIAQRREIDMQNVLKYDLALFHGQQQLLMGLLPTQQNLKL